MDHLSYSREKAAAMTVVEADRFIRCTTTEDASPEVLNFTSKPSCSDPSEDTMDGDGEGILADRRES